MHPVQSPLRQKRKRLFSALVKMLLPVHKIDFTTPLVIKGKVIPPQARIAQPCLCIRISLLRCYTFAKAFLVLLLQRFRQRLTLKIPTKQAINKAEEITSPDIDSFRACFHQYLLT